MSVKFFVTGTDTGVGKTLVSAGLLAAANAKSLSTLALKPVAAGCELTDDGWRNEDALILQQTMSASLSYEQINPIALEPPMAPHVAAEQVGRRISVSRLTGFCRGALMTRTDFALIEGAGGWRVPINPRESLADLAKSLDFPVILVVGMRLGCLNHAYLTAEAIRRDGLKIAGWVANQIDPQMPAYDECFSTLEQSLGAPCLGHIPFLADASADETKKYLDIEQLLAKPAS